MAAPAVSVQTENINNYEELLYAMYADQKRIIKQWGVTLPPEEQLFEPGCPIEAKVMFFDWIIREGLSSLPAIQ